MNWVDTHYEYKYINGNYAVMFRNNVLTKTAFRAGEELISDFPDSIDLKVTNRCSNNCPFCHENSTKTGECLNVEKTIKILEQLPHKPIEIAVGGGNILENIPELKELITWMHSYGFRLRCTIRLEDLLNADEQKINFINKFEAVGLSVSNKLSQDLVDDIEHRLHNITNLPKMVFHVIIGITPLETIQQLADLWFRYRSHHPILFLGYKQWGRAKESKLPTQKIEEVKKFIKQTITDVRIEETRWSRHSIFAFDNLAVEQLKLRDSLLKDEFDRIYLGEEGSHSMYIDAVTGIYSKNSSSAKRVSWDSIGLIEFFKNL